MNKREALVFTAFTGIMCVRDFSEYHAFVEDILKTPVWTHQFADPRIVKQIKEAVTDEFLQIINNVE